MQDQSVKTIYKFTKGNPIHWRIVQYCESCKGSGKTGDKKCSECDGKGKYQKQDVTDLVELPLPKRDTVKIAPDIAGFISPDNETWIQYNNELELLEILTHTTHWGTITAIRDKVNSKTATEVFFNNQPMQNALNKYSDAAQFVEWRLTEFCANFLFPSKDKSKRVSNITYGRNYIIESADTILERYSKARSDQQNTVVLDRLLVEYLTAKYKNDPQWLRIELKKAELEPFVHYTIDMVNSIFGQEKAQETILFGDWWETLTLDDKLTKTTEDLKKEFKTFINQSKSIKND